MTDRAVTLEDKKIGFIGGSALLVASMTGPGLTVIPMLFQQAGWVPTIAFLIFIAILSGFASTLIIEAMASVQGNADFKAQIELTTLAELFLGRRWHVVFQILLYLALQSVTCASLIVSCQSLDDMIIRIFKHTCALSFIDGWICVDAPSGVSSSPFDGYILFSIGYLLTFSMVVPLSFCNLVQNIKIQLASVVLLAVVLTEWIVTFAKEGLVVEVPAFGPNLSQLIGIIILNYAYVTTVPSFINESDRALNIQWSIWFPVLVSTATYILIGWLGAAAYEINPSSDVLSTMTAQNPTTATLVGSYLFPFAALIPSVPVFNIVIQQNLRRGSICGKAWARFWAIFVPWIIIIPFQAQGLLQQLMNYSSLLITSSANFIVPFFILIASKRFIATATRERHSAADLYTLHHIQSHPSRHSSVINEPEAIIAMEPEPNNKDGDALLSGPIRVVRSPAIEPSGLSSGSLRRQITGKTSLSSHASQRTIKSLKELPDPSQIEDLASVSVNDVAARLSATPGDLLCEQKLIRKVSSGPHRETGGQSSPEEGNSVLLCKQLDRVQTSQRSNGGSHLRARSSSRITYDSQKGVASSLEGPIPNRVSSSSEVHVVANRTSNMSAADITITFDRSMPTSHAAEDRPIELELEPKPFTALPSSRKSIRVAWGCLSISSAVIIGNFLYLIYTFVKG